MIPSGFLQELLSRVDIVEIVGRHVQLKKGGVNLMGLCPFHGEKSPSFSVSPRKQFYYCFGCGASGDAIRFLTEFTGVPFRDAVADLAQQVGLQVPDDERDAAARERDAQRRQQQATLCDTLARAAEHYRQQLKQSQRAIDYLKRRGLSGRIAARFGLGYAPEGWRSLASAFAHYDDPLLAEAGLVIVKNDDEGGDEASAKRYDRFRDRVMFPIRSVQGEVIGFGGRVLGDGEPKYLNSPETPVFVKGHELYGLHEAAQAIRRADCALVVEGYMDVVALAQLGIDNAVATLGTACTEDHLRKLVRFCDRIVFSFDGDAAGRRAAARAMEAALPFATETRTLSFLFLPAEHDPDSYVREFGAAAFQRCIEEAWPLSKQLREVAMQGCDLATPEGRARLLGQAEPLWQRLPDGAFKRQMLGELARDAGLPASELAAAWRVAARIESASGDAAATRRAPPASRTRSAAGRRAPRTPQDRALQMLLTHAEWWDRLGPDDHEVLHALAPPHGLLIGWLERELSEHGARPWAVVRAGLEGDADAAAALQQVFSDDPADNDAEFDALRRMLDSLLLVDVERRKAALLERFGSEPQALQQFRELDARWRALRQRRDAQPGLDDG